LVLTIRMNDAAATVLRTLEVGVPAGSEVLGEGLRGLLATGLTDKEGALVLTAQLGGWPGAPASVPAAIAEMKWGDLTGYECKYNSFHLEDYLPIQVTTSEDGQPQISREDQVVLLRGGVLVAHAVLDLVRALPRPEAVRCIVLVNETCGIFRFHRIRPGEDWIDVEDLERYQQELAVVVDGHP